MAYDYDRKDVPFNSSFAFLERIERRWEDADAAKVDGDTPRYFRCLEVIYRNTHPFFEEQEIVEVEDLVVQIEELLATKPMGGAQGRQFASDDVWKGENLCDRLRMLLVKLLFKYKITYAKKEKVDLEDEVEDDF